MRADSEESDDDDDNDDNIDNNAFDFDVTWTCAPANNNFILIRCPAYTRRSGPQFPDGSARYYSDLFHAVFDR